ncbi:MAG TPA: histidine--tRNA ligase, partial [Bacteroidales bacterium]|nr:histidine--tRNA ligase [Bacteroidales bacterium]
DVSIGSICGGGRYDNLTGVFGMEGVSGVGVSFGADRIYDVMTQLNLFITRDVVQTKVMIVNFGEYETGYALKVRSRLIENGISAEVYPDTAKLKKQMAYADSRKIPFIILAGEEEIKNNQVTLKTMSTGEQKKMSVDEVLEILVTSK